MCVQCACDRSCAGGKIRCVALTAEAERGVRRGGEQVREVIEIADVSEQRGGCFDALAQVDDDALAQQAADLQTELQTGVNPADVPPATDPTPSADQEGA